VKQYIYIYCYIYEVSLDTRRQWTALDSIVTQQCNQAVTEFYSNDTVDYRLLFQSGVRLGVRVLQELPAVFNCSVLTFGVQ
jgi:hypothetical protein